VDRLDRPLRWQPTSLVPQWIASIATSARGTGRQLGLYRSEAANHVEITIPHNLGPTMTSCASQSRPLQQGTDETEKFARE